MHSAITPTIRSFVRYVHAMPARTHARTLPVVVVHETYTCDTPRRHTFVVLPLDRSVVSFSVCTFMQTLVFTWDADADDADDEVVPVLDEPRKWGDATAVAASDVPVIPPTWTANVKTTTSGTFPGIPKGTQVFTEYVVKSIPTINLPFWNFVHCFVWK